MAIADKLALLANTKEALRIALNMPVSAPFSSYVDSPLIPFTPRKLFQNNEQGVWYDPSDISTLFQDAAMTIPVTASGDPVGAVMDLSGNGNHATQTVSASRPTYSSLPDRLALDKVDDKIVVVIPTGGWIGTMVLATDQGTASYGVIIPAGFHELGTARGGKDFPGTAIVGAVLRDGALTASEKADTESYFVGNGATASYGAVSDFSQFWRDYTYITEFSLIDFSSGVTFFEAWRYNLSLSIFPANAFDNIKGGDFTQAFRQTSLNEASIDGILVSLVTSGISTGTRIFWQSEGSAPSVGTGQPAIDTLRSRGWDITVTGGY